LMLSILIQEKNDNQVVLSKNALFKVLHMVNENYSECSQLIPSLSEFTKIDIQDIEEFYQSTGSMLKGNLHRALENLRRNKMIFWQPVIMINALEIDENEILNDMNKVRLQEYT